MKEFKFDWTWLKGSNWILKESGCSTRGWEDKTTSALRDLDPNSKWENLFPSFFPCKLADLDPGSSTSHVWLFSGLKASTKSSLKTIKHGLLYFSWGRLSSKGSTASTSSLILLSPACFSRWRYWAKHWSSNALRRCNCKVILVLLQYFLLTFPI